MFYLVDLHKGVNIPFQDAAALARYWRFRFGMDFSQLNLTGKDIFTTAVPAGSYWHAGLMCYLPLSVRMPKLRRWQVLDDAGRSVDIRTWDARLFQPDSDKTRTVWPWAGSMGSKQHWHRRSGPSMLRGTLRAAQNDGYACEVEDIYRLPPNSQKTCRKRTIPDFWDREDYYDRQTKPQQSKSWKDQTKSRRQYAKHKAVHGRPSNKHLTGPEPLDVESLLHTA